MGTRSFIGIVEGKKVRAIYTHWDGYPTHNGKILLEAFNTPEKIHELLDLGDLSCLGSELGEKHGFNDHNDNKKAKNWCLAYGRDRGEEETDSKLFSSEDEFLSKCDEDYTYLFKDGKWFFRNWQKSLKPLTKAAIKKDNEDDEE